MDRDAADLLGQRLSAVPTPATTIPAAPRNDLILRAMRAERTERTPVWLMRQAGRFDPAYLALRERAGLELEELFAHPEYAAEITVLPVRFGVDAAILFQDILTPLTPMGAPFIFRPGPVLDRPVRAAADADALESYDPREELAFVAESISLTLERLAGGIPLLGFAGAPLTLLAFVVEGESPGGDAARTRAFLRDHTDAAERLLQRIASLTAGYLRMQIESGVHAVQLFESCAALFDLDEYRRFALPAQQHVFRTLGAGVPRILFAKDIDPRLMSESGADVISVGSGVPIADARAALPSGAVQGNVDNLLLRDGSPDEVRRAAEACIRAGHHRAHVLNLGHGILKGTPVENVQAMIDTARSVTLTEETSP